ncbi:MAG: cytochrome c-type biogenesis protein CcmH [Pseudomonadota bacterium]|jgi:hypothetical protein
MRSTLPATVVLLLVFILALPAVSSALSASKVTLNFMCPCGTCDEALSTCECPQSDGFRSEIAGMVGRGYSEDQIIQDFTDRFGPQVLIANAAMAPGSGGLLSEVSNKKTVGFILLGASIAFFAFSLGRYLQPTASPAGRRHKAAPRSRSTRKPVRKTRPREEKPGDPDDGGYLEDHEI